MHSNLGGFMVPYGKEKRQCDRRRLDVEELPNTNLHRGKWWSSPRESLRVESRKKYKNECLNYATSENKVFFLMFVSLWVSNFCNEFVVFSYLLKEDIIEDPRYVNVNIILQRLKNVHVSTHGLKKLGGLPNFVGLGIVHHHRHQGFGKSEESIS